MNWIVEKTYIPILVLIPIIILIGFINRKETIDINIHATYYVINNLHLALLLSILLGILAFGYFLTKIFSISLIKWMTISHLLITIFGVLLIYILFKIQFNLEVKSNDIESILKYSKIIERINLTLFSISIITLLIQLLFLINLVIGIIKKIS